MKALALIGSPRSEGNSTHMLKEVVRGFLDAGGEVEEINAGSVHVESCRGCLRCNLIGRCAVRKDDWPVIARSIAGADVLLFASPVYFHHVTAPLKNILDRFRSFMQVAITEEGLRHTPWQSWQKKFVLLLSMGSSDETDARPVIDLFDFITDVLGRNNSLQVICAARLAVAGQIIMSRQELKALYGKLQLSEMLAESDYNRNVVVMRECYDLGKRLLI